MIKATEYKQSNPINRLLLLCTAIRTIPATATFAEGWGQILGCNHSDRKEIFKGLIAFEQLLIDCVNAIKSFEDHNHGLHLKAINDLQGIINDLHYQRRWDTVLNIVSESTIERLTFTNDLLHNKIVEYEVSSNEIDDILNLVNELQKLCIKTTLPNELKETLIDLCSTFNSALLYYKIFGPDYIRKAIINSAGLLASKYNLVEEHKHSIEYSKLTSIIEKLANISTVAVNTPILFEAAKKFLPGH